MTRDPLSECVVKLLRLAADAWAHGSADSAERLAAGAWRIMDGREFVDAGEAADAS